MQTYLTIKQQIAELEKKAEEARQAEIAQVVKSIRESIALYGITARDLGLSVGKTPASRPSMSRPAGVPMYRDPKTGRTWTGKGRAPNWIATKKNRDEFLIAKPAAPARAPVARKSKKAGASAETQKSV